MPWSMMHIGRIGNLRFNINGETKMNKVSIKETLKIMGLAVVTVLVMNAIFQILSIVGVINISEYDSDMQTLIESSSNWFVNFISVVLLGPILEELIFRFAFYTICLKMIPKLSGHEWILIPISALIFGYSHGSIEQIAYAIICGFLLGYLYLYPLKRDLKVDKNLLRPIIFHVTFNAIGYVTYVINLVRS